MAVSEYDKQHITRKEDLDALEANTKRWEAAHASGNQTEMDLAAKNASMIRAAYGYSGGSDGTGYTPLPGAAKYNPTYITGDSSVTRGNVHAYDSTPFLDYWNDYTTKEKENPTKTYTTYINGVGLTSDEYKQYKDLMAKGRTAGADGIDYWARAAAMTGNNNFGRYEYNHDTGTWTATGSGGTIAGQTSKVVNPNAVGGYTYENTGINSNYTPGSGNVGYTKQGTPFSYSSNLSGSGVAANLATGGMRNNFASAGNSSSSGGSSKDAYINNLIGSGYSNPYKNTPFSRFVNQNLYADRYF